ncbi:hypothetical protein AGOR_G00007370 [Albula goreensis]|uniref:Uncharacterized protein n=1 Tax=Albula goreensis TaxID=1534307 RepID=A0A8T3EBH2_9TELE|nr:hypothetical protein AGOR_G00007370 [Albula goreensis]
MTYDVFPACQRNTSNLPPGVHSLKSPKKTLQLSSPPEYVVYTDMDKDSLTTQARHYKNLQKTYKKPKPNQDANLHNVMDELRWILDKGNSKFIDEVKKRCHDFCAKVHFYGVWKKVMKPPMTLDVVEYAIALFRSLSTLFPSPTAPPKKLGHASEALLHVLQDSLKALE